MTERPCVAVENVSFSYNGHAVLEDISFSVEAGGYVGLVGGNGSGKTTLLRILLGLLEPSDGSVKLFGEDIRFFKQWRNIGYVPQHVARHEAAFPATVREVVESGVLELGWRERREAVTQALETAEIANLSGRILGELSGGERQRAFIARALSAHPKLLILDEPTTGVDAASQDNFYAFLARLNRDMNMTVILVSHDLEVVAHEVKTVLCLNRRLVCHVSNRDFIDGDYLKRLYGKDMRYVHHHHDHGHEE